jgi:integrase
MASIRKRGSSWHVQVRRNGYPSLTKSFQIRGDADKWARRIEREVDLGEYKGKRDCPNHKLFSDLLERYLGTVSINKRGYDAEKWRLNSLIRSWLGHIRIDELTATDISRYRDERLNCVSEPSVLIELTLVRHCLQIAIDEWSVPIENNPAAAIRLPKPSAARTRRLEAGELDALLLGCQRGRSTLLAPIIEFAIETGMRRGEIVNARWSDLDCDKCTLHIPITKNGSSRTIPMTDKAMQIVQGLAKADERFFPTTGNAIRLAWVRLKKRVGITDLRFHDLRHEAVSRFFEMGLSVPEVALISGHKDPRMLFRYTHLRAEDVGKKLRAKS